jgi:hypothetical protein
MACAAPVVSQLCAVHTHKNGAHGLCADTQDTDRAEAEGRYVAASARSSGIRDELGAGVLWRGLRRRRVQSGVAVTGAEVGAAFFFAFREWGLALVGTATPETGRAAGRGCACGAGVVGGEFEAGRVFFRGCGWVWMFWWELRRRNGIGSGSGVGLVLGGVDGE